MSSPDGNQSVNTGHPTGFDPNEISMRNLTDLPERIGASDFQPSRIASAEDGTVSPVK